MVEIVCPQCQMMFCLPHRNPLDHACDSASLLPAQQRIAHKQVNPVAAALLLKMEQERLIRDRHSAGAVDEAKARDIVIVGNVRQETVECNNAPPPPVSTAVVGPSLPSYAKAHIGAADKNIDSASVLDAAESDDFPGEGKEEVAAQLHYSPGGGSGAGGSVATANTVLTYKQRSAIEKKKRTAEKVSRMRVKLKAKPAGGPGGGADVQPSDRFCIEVLVRLPEGERPPKQKALFLSFSQRTATLGRVLDRCAQLAGVPNNNSSCTDESQRLYLYRRTSSSSGTSSNSVDDEQQQRSSSCYEDDASSPLPLGPSTATLGQVASLETGDTLILCRGRYIG